MRTVSTNKKSIAETLRKCDSLCHTSTFKLLGACPLGDNVGFTVALPMLKLSTLPE